MQTRARFGYTQIPHFHVTPPYRNWLAWDSPSLQGVMSQASPPPRQGRAGHPSSVPCPRSNTGNITAGAAAVGELCSLRFVSSMSPSEGGARVAARCCQDVGAAQSPAATQEELEQGLEPPGICRQIPTAISPDKPVLLVACNLPCGSSQKLWRPIRHQAGIWTSAHPARTPLSSTEELGGQTMIPKPPAQPIATHITGTSAARAKHIGIL